jgi:hypothetical protein
MGSEMAVVLTHPVYGRHMSIGRVHDVRKAAA